MEFLLSESFYPLLENKSLYLVLVGGAGSGKSEFAGRKIVYRCLKEGGHTFLIIRKVRATIKNSCVRLILEILDSLNIKYEYNRSDLEIRFSGPNGKLNRLLFMGLDDREKIKSIKGLTSIWMEEATEFSREDFMQLDLRLRDPGPHYKQIILTFNPIESEAPWLKEDFFDHPKEGAFIHHSTIDDNPISSVRDEYRKKLDTIGDDTYLKIYRFGQWAIAKGIIFDWDTQELPPDFSPDDIFYGLDFGYSVDPAALIKVYRKGSEYWLEQKIYELGLTNPALAEKIEEVEPDLAKGKAIIYADSAEPKSIDELIHLGLIVKPSIKGADSVRAGIDYLKSLKIHILPGSDDLIDEKKTYKWKTDKSGKSLREPVKFKDHGISAVRYAIYTDAIEGGGYFPPFVF